MRRLAILFLTLTLLLILTACELKAPPANLEPENSASDEIVAGTYLPPEAADFSLPVAELTLTADGEFSFMYNLARSFLPAGSFEFKDGKLHCDVRATDEYFVFEQIDARSYRFLSGESTFFDFEDTGFDLSQNPVFFLAPSFLPPDTDTESISVFNRFLLTLCDRLVKMDPALTRTTDKMSLVVNGADFIADDREQFAALVKENMDLEVMFLSHEELKAEGYLTEDGMVWEDGFLVSVDVQEMTDDRIFFAAELWRSGFGALMPSNTVATFDGSRWTIEFGEVAIA